MSVYCILWKITKAHLPGQPGPAWPFGSRQRRKETDRAAAQGSLIKQFPPRMVSQALHPAFQMAPLDP